MKKKDLLNIVSKQDIIRLINFDDDFLTVARSYHWTISLGSNTTTENTTRILI